MYVSLLLRLQVDFDPFPLCPVCLQLQSLVYCAAQIRCLSASSCCDQQLRDKASGLPCIGDRLGLIQALQPECP